MFRSSCTSKYKICVFSSLLEAVKLKNRFKKFLFEKVTHFKSPTPKEKFIAVNNKRKMLRYIVLLLIISCMIMVDGNTTVDYMMTLPDRQSRVNLVSFEGVGRDIKLGLKFELPFLKVPIKRKLDAYGNESALVNINTAALLSTGLLATSSALISLIFRKYVVLGRDESSKEKQERSEIVAEHELWSILNNFKLVYTNSSGARVGTTLIGFFDIINESFDSNDVDLSSCIKKAICIRILRSAQPVQATGSSGVDKIIDGFIGLKWLRRFLRHTSLKDAIDARNTLSNEQHSEMYCENKYPQCRWSQPEQKIFDIIRTQFKFQ